jgi:hypothetical protein
VSALVGKLRGTAIRARTQNWFSLESPLGSGYKRNDSVCLRHDSRNHYLRLSSMRKPGYRQEWHESMWKSPKLLSGVSAHRNLAPTRSRAAQLRPLILKTYRERTTRSVHGLERIFQISRQTVAHWLRTVLRIVLQFKQTALPAQPGDVVELDELWSFVLTKGHKLKRAALCRSRRAPELFDGLIGQWMIAHLQHQG